MAAAGRLRARHRALACTTPAVCRLACRTQVHACNRLACCTGSVPVSNTAPCAAAIGIYDCRCRHDLPLASNNAFGSSGSSDNSVQRFRLMTHGLMAGTALALALAPRGATRNGPVSRMQPCAALRMPKVMFGRAAVFPEHCAIADPLCAACGSELLACAREGCLNSSELQRSVYTSAEHISCAQSSVCTHI